MDCGQNKELHGEIAYRKIVDRASPLVNVNRGHIMLIFDLVLDSIQHASVLVGRDAACASPPRLVSTATCGKLSRAKKCTRRHGTAAHSTFSPSHAPYCTPLYCTASATQAEKGDLARVRSVTPCRGSAVRCHSRAPERAPQK